VEQLQNGRWKSILIANFTARIVTDIIRDDGDEERRDFGVEAELGGRRLVFAVPAAEFGRMGWVLQKLGPQAIIYPGQQQHARTAIQELSGPIPQEHVFAHLGWTKQGLDWVYLHAAGAMGADGPVPSVKVRLPAALQQYQMRRSEDVVGLVRAVRASLSMLSVAPDHVTVPLLAAAYRAALGKVDFSVFVAGRTGVFKSALAALCQQHFGAAMDASNLPANFASTGNALELQAFYAKDALLVVDDFAPRGKHGDDYALQRQAERLFRAAGNHQGRSRMGGDGRLREQKSPRGLILATGEEVPHGHSIRARMVIVEVGAGDVDRTLLSKCQRAGAEGRLVEAMGAFVAWIARHYEEAQRHRQNRVQEVRGRNIGRAMHARLPSALAELQVGWEMFLQFAREVGAIGPTEREQLEVRSGGALGRIASLQAKYQIGDDPALRFVGLLKAALCCGRAHVADPYGKPPAEATVCGWQHRQNGRGWVAQGSRIGWVAGIDLFLDPTASYQTAQEMAGAERLGVSEQSLRQRLRQCGLLVRIDGARGMVQVRRTLEGRQRKVLHVRSSDLVQSVAVRERRPSQGATAGQH
jgi:hypothetical protein